jgi:hypothetical protein
MHLWYDIPLYVPFACQWELEPKEILMRSFSLLITFLAAVSTIFSQESDSLMIGGDYIRPGQRKNDVLTKLTRYYDVKGPYEYDSYTIWTKQSSSQPPVPVGSLQFQGDKLARVSKDWGVFEGEAVEAFRIFYNALSAMVTKDKGFVPDDVRFPRFAKFQISFSESREPRNESLHITLSIGNRSFAVDVRKYSGYTPAVQFVESVETWDYTR